MGKTVKSFNPLGGSSTLGGFLGGKGPVAKALGLEKKQGEYFDPDLSATDRLIAFSNEKDPLVDPIKGMNTATDYIRNNELTKGVFGSGGMQSRLTGEELDLANRGFQLTQDDREAYGQISGDVARMFGQQEQDAAKALARRGLGSASSGAAGATFSGLAGNKNEMLAQSQMQIAKQRMADTQARLMQNRQMQSSLAQQGMGLAQNQFDNQVNARQNKFNELNVAAGGQNAANQQRFASLDDKRNNKGKSLLEGFGQGLFSSSQQIGAAPGRAANSAAGAGGKSMGGGFGGVA